MTMSFEALQQAYSLEGLDSMLHRVPPPTFIEVTDRAEAVAMLASKTSECWGAGREIGDTGWIQLATPSPSHNGDHTIVFVCRAELVQ